MSGTWRPPNPEAKAPGSLPSEREVELYLEDADLAPFKSFTITRQKTLGAVALVVLVVIAALLALVALFFLFFATTAERPLGQKLLEYGLPLLAVGSAFFYFIRSAPIDAEQRRFWLSVDDRGFATRDDVYESMSLLWAGTLGIQEMPTAFLILLRGNRFLVLPKRQLDDTMQEKLRELARRHPPETPITIGGGSTKTVVLWVLLIAATLLLWHYAEMKP